MHNKYFIRHHTLPNKVLIIQKSPHFYTGKLSLTQSAPHPSKGFGHTSYPGSCLAPRMKYAFIFSPYRYLSFPSMIPHCISRAAAPVATGVAKEVPVCSDNVQVVDEMVNMIVAQRAYELNSKAVTASDEMLQQANNLRR